MMGHHAPRAPEVLLPTFSVKSRVVIAPEARPNAPTINSALMPIAT